MRQFQRCRDDRGSTLIEAALITPVLFLFIFAIFEFGFAFRDYLAVSNGTRDGAREASVAGDVADADYRVLRAVQRATASLPDGAIERVVVYRAIDPEDTVADADPSGNCASGIPVAGVCNVYLPSDFLLPVAEFNCDASNPIPDPDRFWCPRDRQVTIGSGLDYIGIEITITHDYVTGMFGDSVTFNDYIVLKVEPQAVT